MDSKTVAIILVLLLLALLLGSPDEINIYGFKWCLKNCEKSTSSSPNIQSLITPQPTPQTTRQIAVIDTLFIDSLKSRQKIYRLGESATVDFIIKDEWKFPYNFTVLWHHNNTPYFGWSNESNYTNPFSSWYTVNQKGEWKVQVVLNWEYQNQTYSKDELTTFEVS